MVLKTHGLLVRQQTQAINALRAHLSKLGIIAGIDTAKIVGLIAIGHDETDARLPNAARFALTFHICRGSQPPLAVPREGCITSKPDEPEPRFLTPANRLK